MDDQTKGFSLLEATLAKLKKSEESLWGKMQLVSHQWLERLENRPFFQRYGRLRKRPRGIPSLRAEPAIDLDSLFVVSFLFHVLLLFLLAQITFRSAPSAKPEPILVRLLEPPGPARENAQEPKKKTQKKIESQEKPVSPPAPPSSPEPQPAEPAPKVAPSLPGPKVLAQSPPSREPNFASQPAESLIQLPTRSSGTEPTSLATAIDPVPASLARTKGLLSEPSAQGESAKTSKTGPAGQAAFSSPDFSAYLEMLKKRVEDRWRYPEGMSGKQEINILFVIDKGGKLVRAEVLDSSDPRLKSSALAAMKQASPFPPIPESLKELAGWPLRIKFRIDFGVKLSQ